MGFKKKNIHFDGLHRHY